MNIAVQPLGQPTPGSAKPGNLYADLQSRSLWLGVDPAVDSTGSVLISDMIALMSDIAASEDNSKAYTETLLKGDSGLPINIHGYAGTDHVHTHTQITDFNAAVSSVVAATPGLTFKRYTVMLFAGPDVTIIGTGDWVGWALCDGTSYQVPQAPPLTGFDTVKTPNLTDRFILCRSAAHKQGTTNLVASAKTSDAGGHNHGASNYALTINQIPAHGHGPGTLLGPLTGAMTINAAHSHFTTCTSIQLAGGVYRPLLVQSGNSVNVSTDSEPGHIHAVTNLDADINAGVTANAGASAAHTHVIDTQGVHSHTVSMAELREAVPFVALAYIMKL